MSQKTKEDDVSKSKKLDSGCEIADLQVVIGVRDKEGILAVCELNKLFDHMDDIPIKRYYYIVNNSQRPSIRGGHYHPTGKVEFMTCLQGQIWVKLKWRDENGVLLSSKLWLDGAGPRVLLVPELVWHEVVMSESAILLVAANCNYEPGESVEGDPPAR